MVWIPIPEIYYLNRNEIIYCWLLSRQYNKNKKIKFRLLRKSEFGAVNFNVNIN